MRASWILFIRPLGAVFLRIKAHGSEFIDHKRLPIDAEPLLLKNRSAWRVYGDNQCNDHHRDCQNQQAQKRAYYVKNTLRYQKQLLLPQYRLCYLNDHIGRAFLCQTAGRC